MQTTAPRASQAIAKRAVLIGTILIIGNSYWIAYVEMIWHTAHLTTVAMSVNVMFGILAMTLLNIGVRRIFPRIALEPRDLLVVYSMLAVGSAFSGHDCIPRLMGLIPYAFRFATPENDWEALLFHHLPEWLVVKHPKTVTDFYEGEVNFFTGGYVQHWIIPILSWSAVIFLLMLIFLCLTALIRKQWIENEKLAYPIIQIPLEITTNRHIFRNRLLWIGFGIAMGINLLNGLQFFFPVLPEIPVRKYNLNIYFTQKPWNAMGSMPLRFHPYLIGFSFILPLDLAFSCAFFYLMKKVQLLVGSTVGIATLPGYPFLGEQGAGALLALLAIACWHARHHFAAVLRQVVHPNRRESQTEALSYRSAVITLGICLLLLAIFCIRGGMSLWAFAIYIGIYLMIVVGLTRMRAELGPPIHAIGYLTPQYMMISLLGTRRLRPGNLTMLSLMNWLSGASYASFRTHPMPDQLEAFKLAERTGIRNRTMFGVLVIASLVGILSSLILYPYAIYREGVAAGSEQIHAGGADTYNFLSSWLVNPKPTDWLATSVLGLAFAANLGIMFLRSRFVWCPLHPAGYVIGVAPGTTDVIWFPLLLAMVAKWLILKHGGINAYRKAVPFFIGLVLGEALMGCFWPLLSLILRSAVYSWI
ncbi:hypothetical protein C6503_17210 [Candidatus Poribacteria bacterium]|nr:MAG: hypothetical protein C6503_17210 [Candidatus Poribacteria bacterium]